MTQEHLADYTHLCTFTQFCNFIYVPLVLIILEENNASIKGVCKTGHKEENMLHYAVIFFILAIISAFLGFGNLAGTFSQLAKILTGIFVISFVISLMRHLFMG